jgi:hypothetical protein
MHVNQPPRPSRRRSQPQNHARGSKRVILIDGPQERRRALPVMGRGARGAERERSRARRVSSGRLRRRRSPSRAATRGSTRRRRCPRPRPWSSGRFRRGGFAARARASASSRSVVAAAVGSLRCAPRARAGRAAPPPGLAQVVSARVRRPCCGRRLAASVRCARADRAAGRRRGTCSSQSGGRAVKRRGVTRSDVRRMTCGRSRAIGQSAVRLTFKLAGYRRAR